MYTPDSARLPDALRFMEESNPDRTFHADFLLRHALGSSYKRPVTYRSKVYVVHNFSEVLYVGQTTCLRVRAYQHSKGNSPLRPYLEDVALRQQLYFSAWVVDHADAHELAAIVVFRPTLNKSLPMKFDAISDVLWRGGYWITKAREVVPIDELGSSHLENILRLLEKQAVDEIEVAQMYTDYGNAGDTFDAVCRKVTAHPAWPHLRRAANEKGAWPLSSVYACLQRVAA